MKIIKQKILTHEEKYYSYPVKVLDENDISLLNTSRTTGLKHFNTDWMDHPRYWNNEKFKLPFNTYSIVEYEDVYFNNIRKHLPPYDDGNRIEILTKESSIDSCEYIEKVFPALNFGGCEWQHFIQDILPILIFAKDFLDKNLDVSIMLYEQLQHKAFAKYFLDKLEIKNPICYTPYYWPFTEEKTIYKCKKLYNFECDNQMPVYWWNNFFYKDISNQLTNRDSLKNNLIYCRRTNNRVFSNEDEVRKVLQNYANMNNLNYIEFEEHNYTMQQKEDIFKDAHTVVSPHGGANYHIIFCSAGAKFIEYTFVDCMYSLYNIASSLDLDYYMVPNQGTNSTYSISVDIDKLNTLLNL